MKIKNNPRFANIKSLRLASLLEMVESEGRASWKDIPNQAGIYIVYLPPGISFSVRKKLARLYMLTHLMYPTSWRNGVRSIKMNLLT